MNAHLDPRDIACDERTYRIADLTRRGDDVWSEFTEWSERQPRHVVIGEDRYPLWLKAFLIAAFVASVAVVVSA